ncbi:glycosyltransferase [Actinomadura logoneensis]|uniref:Glycosyltransferase n=1 Tax=Actinomadura logoneensis TaxID=2293572 RepID=A0A372JJV5_9ACTN|nr:glycosyltransferase [Actinomadura logoneensis]RFU40134.1 glycosyltransferase [Actinomadura logoneensis]
MRTEGEPFVAAVVVTYRRQEKLASALAAVFGQSRPPDAVVVVDNASGDGTAELVRRRFAAAELVELRHNTGGAGGFAAGIVHALGRGADLLWLMDDDTVPEPGALAALLSARRRVPGPPALVASRVVWTDGRDHPMNTPRVRPGTSPAGRAAAEAAGCVPIRSASFVSVLVEADEVRRSGPPVADYFLWNDDFEFTLRLLRRRVGVLCRDSVVVHHTARFGGTETDPGERFFFEVRNKVWLFTRSRGPSPAERLLYGGSSVRRWARTFAASGDRATLRRGLARGLWAGLASRPRPTAAVLAEASPSRPSPSETPDSETPVPDASHPPEPPEPPEPPTRPDVDAPEGPPVDAPDLP